MNVTVDGAGLYGDAVVLCVSRQGLTTGGGENSPVIAAVGAGHVEDVDVVRAGVAEAADGGGQQGRVFTEVVAGDPDFIGERGGVGRGAAELGFKSEK